MSTHYYNSVFFSKSPVRHTFLSAISIQRGGQKNEKVDRKGGQKTRDAIIALIASNPTITTTQMAKSIGINRSALSKHLKRLQDTNFIRRIGPAKGGHWEIIK